MLAEYFTRELRLKISLCSVIILAAISQAVGWSFFTGQYVYRRQSCTYYLSGFSSCPLDTKSYYSRKNDNYYYCDYYDADCKRAFDIQKTFFVALLYPLIYLGWMLIFSICFYLSSIKRYNCLRCMQILWIFCYFACTVLFFTNAKDLNKFSDSTRNDFNTNIKDVCIGLGILCIFKLIIISGLNYDLHYYIKDQIIIIPEPTFIIQNAIILQPGQSQAPQFVYNGPQYIQQSNISMPNYQQFYSQPSNNTIPQTFEAEYGYIKQTNQGQYPRKGYLKPIYSQKE